MCVCFCIRNTAAVYPFLNTLQSWQYHGCSPILQHPLRNKLQVTERYINHSSWYLFRSTCCKRGATMILLQSSDLFGYRIPPFCNWKLPGCATIRQSWIIPLWRLLKLTEYKNVPVDILQVYNLYSIFFVPYSWRKRTILMREDKSAMPSKHWDLNY